jgi:hypothetical protein
MPHCQVKSGAAAAASALRQATLPHRFAGKKCLFILYKCATMEKVLLVLNNTGCGREHAYNYRWI